MIASSAEPPTGVVDSVAALAPVVAWWRGSAVPVTTPEPEGNTSDLEQLVDFFADAKVVGLGESTHGAHQLFAMKHRLIEFLVSRLGYTAVAFEASYSGCVPIDEFVRHGRGDAASALTGQGYTAWDTAEVAALLRWLRGHNDQAPEDHRVEFWGLDSGYNAVGRAHVMRYLRRTNPALVPDLSSTFDALNELEARWPFALSDTASESALSAAHEKVRTLERTLDTAGGGDGEAERVARFVRQMRRWTGPDRNDRSRLMGETLLELLDQAPTDAKVVVWAHNAHIGRGTDHPELNFGDILTEGYGDAYVAVSLEFGEGTCHQRALDADLASGDLVVHSAGPSPVGSLPWCLASTGQQALAVDLRRPTHEHAAEAWLRQPQTEHAIGWTSADWAVYDGKSIVPDKYDAIVYVDTITPSQPTANAVRTIARRERY